MRSIQLSLIRWLIAPLLAVNVIGAALVYWLVWVPLQTELDHNLTDNAWAIASSLEVKEGKLKADLPEEAQQMLRADRVDSVYFVVRNSEGEIIAGDADFPQSALPRQLDQALASDGEMRDGQVRIVTLRIQIETQEVLIGIAETLRKRIAIQSRMLLALSLLEVAIAVLSIAVVWFAVRQGLWPLQRTRAELNARSPDDLSPVSEETVPLELRPFVAAINDLLKRTQAGAKARQDFLADVAHQLRTPLAGLKTQVEWLQQKYAAEDDTVQSATMMIHAIERMTHQSNQLLALARAEPSQFEKSRLEPLELDKLVEESIQHFVQEADKKDIDLGFDLQPTRVRGDRFLLRDLLDNLIDNAIRYSPPAGAVTVSCRQSPEAGVITVEDSGPGIPAGDREKIFNRFYRIDHGAPGSGLGLAIVRDIAKDHDARITLQPATSGSGTIFVLEFPFPSAML